MGFQYLWTYLRPTTYSQYSCIPQAEHTRSTSMKPTQKPYKTASPPMKWAFLSLIDPFSSRVYAYIYITQIGLHSASITPRNKKRQSMKLSKTVLFPYLFNFRPIRTFPETQQLTTELLTLAAFAKCPCQHVRLDHCSRESRLSRLIFKAA